MSAGRSVFLFRALDRAGQPVPLADDPLTLRVVPDERLGELDPAQEIITHCKMGGRSAQAVDYLRQQGFKNVKNLSGGINAWSEKIDPKVPKY